MKKQRIYLLIQTALCLITAAALLFGVLGIYAGSAQGGAVFSRESIAAALRPAFPLALLLLLSGAAGRWVIGRQTERPIRSSDPAVDPSVPSRIPPLRAILFLVSALLIAYGIWNGSMRDVLYKAIVICSECIGLG